MAVKGAVRCPLLSLNSGLADNASGRGAVIQETALIVLEHQVPMRCRISQNIHIQITYGVI